MNANLSLPQRNGLSPKLFFFLLFLYQVLFTFQGVDLSDEGFFGTFYQQIFQHPESVQYNFMFWLSGVVGGIFTVLFGDLGVWGLRLFTAIITTGSIILVYNLLKNYLKPANLQLGLLIILLVNNNNTKVFHYDNLSIFFYIVTTILLVKGLQKDKPAYLLLAGVFVALDTFTRIPSVVNTGLVLAVFYYGYLHHIKFRKQLGQAILFGAGFLAGIAITLLTMKLSGQLTIFLNAVKLVGKMGSGGEESAYGLQKLIMQFINAYFASIKIAVIVLAALLALAIAANLVRKTGLYRRWMTVIIQFVLVASVLYLLYAKKVDNFYELYFLTGITLIAGALMLLGKTLNDLKVLMFIGCYILLTYPLGSGAGLYSVGIYSLWIGFPIAVDYIAGIRGLTTRFRLQTDSEVHARVLVNERQFTDLRLFTWIMCIVIGLYYSWYNPFFDYHPRTRMTAHVDNKYLRYVYTTPDRAALLNELFHESEKYVQPGDYVLAYYSIPMFHYATHTVPFVYNSMPWFYPPPVFKEELDTAIKKTNLLPVVVMQKRKMTGLAGGGWPDPAPFYDQEWYRKNIPRDSILQAFLQANGYTKKWENEMFMILLPAK